MSRPQHPMLALGGAHEHQAHEGRVIELEAKHAFAVQERLKPLLALSLRDSAPIEPLDGNLDSLDHVLHGLRDAFPAKTAAQNRMPLGDPLPGAKELRFVQRLVQRCDHLLDVSAGISSAEAMEEHPRLQRRQFVGIDYGSHGALCQRPAAGCFCATNLAIRSIVSRLSGVTSASAMAIPYSVSRNVITSRMPVESMTPAVISESSSARCVASLT